MMTRTFEEIEHTADYAIRAYGRDLRELVENAGRGMISLIVDPSELPAERTVEVSATAADAEQLVVRALKEILFLEEDGLGVPVRFAVATVDAERFSMQGTVGLASLEAARSALRGGIKAVTYHNLQIVHRDGLLSIEITFDV
jgi:SHS2 domain-containing protein